MRDSFYFETEKRSQVISMEIVNNISSELIAATNNSDDLNRLVENEIRAHEARQKALVIAFKEFPNPTGFIPMEDRRELVEKRNRLVEELIEKFMQE